ncbi:MAG: hypothetical protein HY429_02410 [Candidatus Levybacteria bacterium]|nr:hypothetical protein [Candidatus Levybacteria bacterium]
MVDAAKLSLLILQSGSFIAAFAAIAAAFIMFAIRKKIGSGILASGFTTIAVGVLSIAVAIIIDAAIVYMQQLMFLLFIKNLLFIAGTYTIIIGSKKIRDNLEFLAK